MQAKPKGDEPPSPMRRESVGRSEQRERRASRLESRRERVDEIMELCRIAKTARIPQIAVKQAAQLFKEWGTTQGASTIRDWRMSEAQFRRLLCWLTHRRSEEELPVQFAAEASAMCVDPKRPGFVDFAQFAVWLSNNSFSEDFNLDESQKGMRALARKHGLHYPKIDLFKRAFDEFDQDSSGGIDPEEFEHLIYKCGKVPHKALPPSRVQQWWRDADADGNGVVDFEEFLVFQRKYFDDGQGGKASGGEGKRSGFENYYRGIRKHCWT